MGASLSECSACYVLDVHRGAWHGALHRAVLQGEVSNRPGNGKQLPSIPILVSVLFPSLHLKYFRIKFLLLVQVYSVFDYLLLSILNFASLFCKFSIM